MSARVTFNRVWRCWNPFPEYYAAPWEYFTGCIELAKARGARFITMSQALRREYRDAEITLILDHHVDYYPLELEVMCQWEREAGVVSSVYLFNKFDVGAKLQIPWSLEDLDVEFYKGLERSGFEVGYHQNVIGRTRYYRTGHRQKLDPATRAVIKESYDDEFMAQASRLFREDVDNLRRHFDVRTMIPHGAGEDNTAFTAFPPGYDDLVWVYNRAGKGKPLRFKSFSDSSGVRAQRLSGYGATYFAHRDHLGLCMRLLEPGLNHVLVHPGRFAKGMPYALRGIDEASHPGKVERSFDLDPPHDELPPVPDLVAGWLGGERVDGALASDEPAGRADRYELYADDVAVLMRHMAKNARVIPFLVHHLVADKALMEKLSEERATRNPANRALRLPRREAGAPRTPAQFAEDFHKFYNQVYAGRIFQHLRDARLRPAALHFERAPLERREDVDAMVEVLRALRADVRVRLPRSLTSLSGALAPLKGRYGVVEDPAGSVLRSLPAGEAP